MSSRAPGGGGGGGANRGGGVGGGHGLRVLGGAPRPFGMMIFDLAGVSGRLAGG
jgi:hypothetical protein